MPLERLVDVPAVRVDVTGSGTTAIDAPALLPYELRGRAVLLHTGHDRLWGTDAYGHDNPFLTAAAVKLLADAGAAIVGIDSVNIDDPADLTRPARFRAPRGRHPDLRAPHEPRRCAGRGRVVQRNPGAGPRNRHVPGPCSRCDPGVEAAGVPLERLVVTIRAIGITRPVCSVRREMRQLLDMRVPQPVALGAFPVDLDSAAGRLVAELELDVGMRFEVRHPRRRVLGAPGGSRDAYASPSLEIVRTERRRSPVFAPVEYMTMIG